MQKYNKFGIQAKVWVADFFVILPHEQGRFTSFHIGFLFSRQPFAFDGGKESRK